MLAIYKKEIKSYFSSIVGYLFLGFFLIIEGLYHFIYNFGYGNADYSFTLDGITIFFVFLVPLLSMRIFAEEKRQKTDQLLLTSPVSVPGLVLGKYLAMLTLLLMAVAVMCIHPLVLSKYGDANLPGAYMGVCVFTLLGAVDLAIGMFISAHCESQVISAVVTFIVILMTALMNSIISAFETDARTAWLVFSVCILLICVVLYLALKNVVVTVAALVVLEGALLAVYLLIPSVLEGAITKVFGWFSLMTRLSNGFNAIFDLGDVVYYLSLIGVFVFLTVQTIEKRRWN